MVGMMGKVSDRFHEYQSAKDLRQRLQLAKQVTNAAGIDIVYSSEYAGDYQNHQGLGLHALCTVNV